MVFVFVTICMTEYSIPFSILLVLFRGTNSSSPGIWYSFEGTGGLLQVQIDSFLASSVYAGSACDALTCVQPSNEDLNPTIFDSELGGQYLIYVYSVFDSGRSTFNITMNEYELPSNDDCKNATPLEIDGAPT